MTKSARVTTPFGGRRLLVLMLVAVFGLAGSVLTPPRASLADSYPSDCPELTDSITRLYYAYLERPPNANEFHIWSGRYQRGESTLYDISSSLMRSDAFKNRYGTPSDRQFIQIAYRNIRDERPGTDDMKHWSTVIDRGHPRALMVLAMTETEQFTRATATARPLAGYDQWYPPGTHWYCGSGTDNEHSVIALGRSAHIDVLFKNTSLNDFEYTPFTLEIPSRRPLVLAQGQLPGMAYDYRWDQRIETNRDMGGFLSVTADNNLDWSVVIYPESIGPNRSGWQIRP